MKLTKKQSEWLTSIYNTAFRASGDNQFSIRLAAKLYDQTRFNPSFETPDGAMAGIAALPTNQDGVDPKNTQESIEFAVQSELENYIANDGDLNTVAPASEELDLIEATFDEELFGKDATFTDIESRDQRFKRAMTSNSTDELGNIIDEIAQDRAKSRSQVMSNGA